MTRPARNAPKASDAPAAAVPRAVRGIDVALAGESLEDDGGAGERDEKAQEQRPPPAEMEGHGEHATEGHREADLSTAPGDDLPSHLAQSAQGELDADGKEQQDDADFRQALDLVHVRHQAECVGAE